MLTRIMDYFVMTASQESLLSTASLPREISRKMVESNFVTLRMPAKKFLRLY